MRIVVMDEDMYEPITVVEIPMYLMRQVQERKLRYIVLAIPITMRAWATMLDKIPNVQDMTVSHVHLRMEPIHKGNGILYWVAVPDDPALALLLRAAFLPGQVTEMRRREAVAWFQGAVASL